MELFSAVKESENGQINM